MTFARKSDLYRSWTDVQPLIDSVMAGVNDGKGTEVPGSPNDPLSKFVEEHYLPWCKANKSAPTANGYTRVWEVYWKPHVGRIKLTDLLTSQVTAVLTKHAKNGKGPRTLSHIKWMLSGFTCMQLLRASFRRILYRRRNGF